MTTTTTKPEFSKNPSAIKGSTKKKVKNSSVQGRFSSYIAKVLKNTDKTMTMSQKSMAIMNSFCVDNLNKIMDEAALLCQRNKIKTLTAREIQTAARLVLPGELARMACNEGAKAVANFAEKSKRSANQRSV